jgi:hypothetical protein
MMHQKHIPLLTHATAFRAMFGYEAVSVPPCPVVAFLSRTGHSSSVCMLPFVDLDHDQDDIEQSIIHPGTHDH